ncbi:hypothetical protein ABZ864_47995 [Streptomyces sp. NPDC047082]|uniref:hypothetical protein n=1 Tax=Streptomyces sp. NPDC047082 TaxID=3155259 RepID=UPI0033F50317
MSIDDVLRHLGIDPAALAPAPPQWSGREASARIAAPPPPCAGCGQPARATTVADVPGHGPRWLDRCRACLLATIDMTPSRMPSTTEEIVADLRAGAVKAGVSLGIAVDQHKGARHG